MVRIGFSTQRFSPLSSLIRWVTGAKCSHTWVLVDIPALGGDFVMEASDFGYRLQEYSLFKKHHTIVAVIDPKVPLDEGVKVVGPQLGTWYDYSGLLGMAVVYVGRWLRRKWRNPLQNSHSVFCSESVVQILQASNYPNAQSLEAGDTSPEDLLEFLQT